VITERLPKKNYSVKNKKIRYNIKRICRMKQAEFE